jgi:DNA polymerase III alpha subunit (gram-positive type)
MVAGAPSVDRVIGDLDGLFDGRIVVGHGVDFDLTIINRERGLRGLPRLANPALDTQRLAAVICPQWRDYSLETVAARLGVEVVGRHTAPGDALAAGRVLLALLPLLEGDGVRTVSELVWLQRRPIVR